MKKKSRAPEMHRLASLDQSGDRQSICFCRLIDVEVAIACSCSQRLRLPCSFFGNPCGNRRIWLWERRPRSVSLKRFSTVSSASFLRPRPAMAFVIHAALVPSGALTRRHAGAPSRRPTAVATGRGRSLLRAAAVSEEASESEAPQKEAPMDAKTMSLNAASMFMTRCMWVFISLLCLFRTGTDFFVPLLNRYLITR